MGKFNAPIAQESYEFSEHEGVLVCRARTLKYSASNSIRRILSWIHFEWKLLRLPIEKLPRPDAIIASSLSLLTVLNGLRLRRRFGCRLIFEVQDIWPLTLVEVGHYSPRNPLLIALRWVERLGYRRADAVVGTMPNLVKHVRESGIADTPVFCIPQGFDPDAQSSPSRLPDEYVAKYLLRNRFIVGYVGSIGAANALDVLLRAASRLTQRTDVHFILVGDGELRESLIERYSDLTNVTFAPSIPRSQVADLLERCDLLVFTTHDAPIYRYGISLNKLIDYMISGKPVLGAYSGFKSMISEARSGSIVPANDQAELEKEILRYADMTPAEREEIGRSGRMWLNQNRKYQKLAADYLTCIFPAQT